MGVFATVLRFLFFKLDEIVFGLIGTVYTLLVDISETAIFTKGIFSAFFERIYGILGIFMLFKVSFSILTYVVNPDDFADKNKGFNKMVSNILITLVLLVLTPWFFEQAMDLQHIILNDNIIGRLVLGVSGTNPASTQSYNPGNQMAYQTLLAFYHVDTDRYPECQDFVYKTEINPETCLNSNSMGLNSEEIKAYSQILKYGKLAQSVNIYLDWDLVFAKDANDNPIMSYTPLISTIAGGFIVYVLISFCFDIAVRSVKLGFLQLIAPIPIISRIDPKKGKEVFDKWVKNCMSTYLDLFVRLLAIYFSVFVISELTTSGMKNVMTGESQTNLFVKVFIILGALLFAKQLPNLLQDLLGIKLDGKFSLSPMKKLRDVPLVGGKAAGLVTKGVGVADQVVRAAGGIAWDSKLMTPLRKVTDNVSNYAQSRSAAFANTDFGNRFTGGDAFDKKIKTLEDVAKYKDTLKSQADFDTKDRNFEFTNSAGNKEMGRGNVKALKQFYDDLKNSGTANREEIRLARDQYENAQQVAISSNDNDSINAIKSNMASYVKSNRSNLGGAEFSKIVTDFDAGSLDYGTINQAYIKAQNQIVETKNSASYVAAQERKASAAEKQKQNQSKKS